MDMANEHRHVQPKQEPIQLGRPRGWQMDAAHAVVLPSSETRTLPVGECLFWPSCCASLLGRPCTINAIRIRPCKMILVEYVTAVSSPFNFRLQ
jgi:hypothetical protein